MNLFKFLFRYSIAFPSHLIPLLEDMFTDYEEDTLTPESVPNLIFNDNEDWETIPNSNLIFFFFVLIKIMFIL
jgi:hypothetical protein